MTRSDQSKYNITNRKTFLIIAAGHTESDIEIVSTAAKG